MYLCTPQKNGCFPEITFKKQPKITLIILNDNTLKKQLSQTIFHYNKD